MINKVTPSFTSKISVVYNKDFGLRHFYSSPEADEQLKELKFNGNKDSVTLIPVPGRYEKVPRMQVQVAKRIGHGIAYDNQVIYEPEELLKAYQKALANIDEGNAHFVKDDAIIMDYMA